MPTLKQITCSIQLGPSDTKLKEYGHRFTDGGVEAFVAVPDTKIPFNVRVTSSGYIAPGLAAYVFMDGQYQCNRNRQRLQLPAPGMSARDYEVDFRLRQKEEKTAEGTFVAREWTFAELRTGNADKAADTNPAFAKNVGTIEVVILRCKGDAAHDPAETVIDGGGETGLAGGSRAPSVAHSAPAAKARTSGNVHAKGSKPPSKAPAKEQSVADDASMGGMFGLFDGAGDDPGYGRRMPGHYDDRSPLPRYRSDPRHDNRYSPRPFTVHGTRGNQDTGDQRARPYDTRPRTANEHYALPGTLHAGYDFQQRRRFAPESVQQSPMQRDALRPYHDAYTPRAPPSSLLPRASAPEGFSFVLEICKEIEGLYRLSFRGNEKCGELAQEAQAWENDPEMHLSAMKALRQKQQELQGLGEQLTAMRQSIYARMKRMNPSTWQYTRDYLVLEVRLFDPNDPHMQQWPDPRLQQHLGSPDLGMTRTSGAIDDRTGPSPRTDDGWQEQGQGETIGGLQQRQSRKQSSAQKSAGDGWGAEPQQANDNWATDDVDAQVSNKGGGGAWGDDGGANNGDSQGWDSSAKKGDNNNAWNQNDSKSDSKKDANSAWGNAAPENGGGGWGANENSGSKQADDWDKQEGGSNNDAAWPSNNDGAGSQKTGSKKGDDAWGGGANNDNQQNNQWSDNKSQSAKSKTNNWDDGNKKAQSGAGWGNQSKAKSQGGRGGWEEVGAGAAHARSNASSRRPARSTTSVALEPVIKPYWADWNKSQQDSARPRVQARDPYEYPRPATVLAPSGRARDVSHGVQAGKGADYAHKTFRPEYLDTMDRPYAIFTFKYRTQSALERILKRRIDTGDVRRAVDEAEKEKLMRLPKDELVQEMLKMRLNPSRSGSKSAAAAKAPSNTGWGGDQQADDVKPSDSVSNHTARRSNRGGDAWGAEDNKRDSSRKSKANGGGWGADAGGDAWNKSDKRSEKKAEAQKPKSGAGGWDTTPAAGGNDAWGAAAGGDAWEADKGGNGKASSKSEAHFAADDPGMKATGEQKPTDSWAAGGW